MTGRRILILAVALAALASPAEEASASCLPAPLLSQAIDDAAIVFVGTVVALDDDGRLEGRRAARG